MSAGNTPSVVALAGGVGGARLVDGLDRVVPKGDLAVVVNTGDDFEHWGLHVSPDLDTVMYTLAGLAPEDRGWGIAGDSFHVLAEAERRGAESWFRLGDRDLVTHLTRSAALAQGETLTDATAALCAALGVSRPLLPMSDDPRPTRIVASDGRELTFQDWLVRMRGEPAVQAVQHPAAGSPTEKVMLALQAAQVVVLCPSNPYVSIDPILNLSGVRDVLRSKTTVAVSPLVHGRAVKGPLGTMVADLAHREPSAAAIADHYEGLLNGYVVHRGDRFDAPFPLLETNILIQSRPDRVVLARELLRFAQSLP